MDVAVLEVRSNRPGFASFRFQACNRGAKPAIARTGFLIEH
jgi:hypothetical protein